MKTINYFAVIMITLLLSVSFNSNSFSKQASECVCCDANCNQSGCCNECSEKNSNACSDKCVSDNCKETCSSGSCSSMKESGMKMDQKNSDMNSSGKMCSGTMSAECCK